MESLEQKEDAIAEKKQQAEAFLLEAEGIKANQFEILERISGFTAEQAKEFLLKNLENELVHEKAAKLWTLSSKPKMRQKI